MRRSAEVIRSFTFLSAGIGQKMTRMELFEFLLKRDLLSQTSTLNMRRQISTSLHIEYQIYRKEDDINTKISLFSNKILIRWKASRRNKIILLNRNVDWLIEVKYSSKVILTDQELYAATGSKRPINDFVKSNIRTERRRTEISS